MFKIQLQNGEYYASKRGRVQHYGTMEKAAAKIKKLGDIATDAIVVECKARTTVAKIDKLEEKTDVKAIKAAKAKKKPASKPEKPASVKSKSKKNKN